MTFERNAVFSQVLISNELQMCLLHMICHCVLMSGNLTRFCKFLHMYMYGPMSNTEHRQGINQMTIKENDH